MRIRRVFLLTMALVLLFVAAGCTNGGGDTTTTPSTEISPPVTTVEPTTDVLTTTEPETAVEPGPTITLELKWNKGYVGSSTHSSVPNMLNPAGSYYSYTDVFTVEKSGTRITFFDNNTNSNGDTGYASNAAYVISSWKSVNNQWVINTDGINIAGSSAGNSVIAKNNGGIVTYTYITAVDNENIRLCYRSGQTVTFTPSVFPTVTSQFTGEPGTASSLGAEQKAFDEYIAEQKSKAEYTQLKGITMYALGDSYFAGSGLNVNYVWPAILAAKYDIDFINYGINGSTMSGFDPTHNPMSRRYRVMTTAKQPDIILVEGGKNDYNYSVPIGNDTDTLDNTFKGALNMIIDGLESRYPKALIICITPWKVAGVNSLGNEVQTYANAMIELCAKRGIHCFNASDPSMSGVDMTNTSFRAQYCLTATDVSHLNLAGHKYVLAKFEKYIAEAYAAAKSGN